MKNLVIVESPNKIKSIEKYLGQDYKVVASVGHIVKLPSSGEQNFGVDIQSWTPNYKLDPAKKGIISEIKNDVKKVKKVYIATDPDREGEAIADNLVHFLKIGENYHRIRFNEITEGVVKQALANPTTIDQNLVNSQIARRILDRIIGFKLSELMRKTIKNSQTSPSAGRVQSIALKLVVEREKAIKEFVSEEYHNGFAKVTENVLFTLFFPAKTGEKKEWIEKTELESIKKSLTKKLIVEGVKVSQKKERAIVPFKQSALYKRADSTLNLASTVVQSAAQRLYEGYGDGGLISYPRTDSTRLSNTFVQNAQKYIANKFGKVYVADKIKGFAGKQDAHEAIRPTSLSLTPQDAKSRFKLKEQEFKVYKLIYENTIKSLMTVPLKKITSYVFQDNKNFFRYSNSQIIFNGYYVVDPERKTPPEGFDVDKKLKKGDLVEVKEYVFEKKQTKPLPHYNEGSLIEQLDIIGVGRPSTFATTINILKTRAYVKKDGKALLITELGKIVYEKLTSGFPKVMNEKYTSQMEANLDEIAEGQKDKNHLLDSFWASFQKNVEEATQTITVTKMQDVPAGVDCSKCNAPMIVKINKRDKSRFFACSRFPECRNTMSDPTYKKSFFARKKAREKRPPK